MTLDMFLQHCFNALTLGSLYALIAIAIIAVIMVAVILRYSGKTKTINELNNLKIRPPRRHLK